MAEVIFVFKDFENTFQIERTVSLETICKKYSNLRNIPLKNMYFLYEGNKIDFKLSFNDIAKEEDKIKGKIIILVLLNECLNDKNEMEKNKIKANILYEELNCKYDFYCGSCFEEEIKKKIIEFNFNENKFKEFYNSTDRIFEEMDGLYGLSSFMDEEEVKNKIRELNHNRNLIVNWIEEVLLNYPN